MSLKPKKKKPAKRELTIPLAQEQEGRD